MAKAKKRKKGKSKKILLSMTSLKPINDLLEQGERRYLASRYGLTEKVASNLLNDVTRPKDIHTPFINACIDRVLPRKERNEMLKRLL